MSHKTNAVRLLDQMRISYELGEYAVDPEDLAATTVAAKIGLSAAQVFKTLVARGDRNGICMAVIPGNAELDLKALTQATGDRSIQLVLTNTLEAVTGYGRASWDSIVRAPPDYRRATKAKSRPSLVACLLSN